MHDPHAPLSQHPGEPRRSMPSRLDAPDEFRAALARSLDRLAAGSALASGRLVRIDRIAPDDRTWTHATANSDSTRTRLPGSLARAFLDAAEASVRLRALLLDRSDRSV